MEYEITRPELVTIFCSRFIVAAHADLNLNEVDELWDSFLSSVLDMGLIDQEVRDLWVESGCPRAPVYSALAVLYGDGTAEDLDYLDEFEEDLEDLKARQQEKRALASKASVIHRS